MVNILAGSAPPGGGINKLSEKQGRNKPKHKEKKLKYSLGNGENVEFSYILDPFWTILYQNP